MPSLFRSKPLGTGRQEEAPGQSESWQQGVRQVPKAQRPDWQWGEGASPDVQAAPSAPVPGEPATQTEAATGFSPAVSQYGTCRPQVVEKETSPLYYRLISAFNEKTGVPIVINTSLNRRGEPVVCNPKDAMLMFEGSGLEYMAIGNFLVTKKKTD